MSRTVLERLERLPRRGLTVLALQGVSTLVPGRWSNITSAEALITEVIGSSDSPLIAQVRQRADQLSRARHEGYGRALSLYDAVNRSQHTAGVPLLRRLAAITPASDQLQAVDLSLKVAAELLAFTQVNGLPGDSFADFAAALADYGSDLRQLPSYRRMAGLIPGRGDGAHLAFLRQGVEHWSGWAGGFVAELGLTGQKAA